MKETMRIIKKYAPMISMDEMEKTKMDFTEPLLDSKVRHLEGKKTIWGDSKIDFGVNETG